jgi:hypothetical protein
MFNQWYDFVYHVKCSSDTDGFLEAWLNGQQLLNYAGPTLYTGQSCYLKLANYHTPLGLPVSVIHDRIVRGTTLTDVEISSSNPMPVPASMAIANAGLGVGTLMRQSSATVASGYVISESPAADTQCRQRLCGEPRRLDRRLKRRWIWRRRIRCWPRRWRWRRCAHAVRTA